MKPRFLTTTALLLLSVAASSQTIEKGAPLPITLTAVNWRGVFAIEGRFEGARQSEVFVLSTGMKEGAVHPQLARNRLLPLDGKTVSLFVMSRRMEAPGVAVKRLSFNGLNVSDLSLGSLDVAGELSNRAGSLQDSPGGWLGNSFLSLFQVTLDYTNQQITLEDPKAPLPKSPEALQLPFTFKDGRIWVKVAVAGAKPFQAVLDTGVVGTVIPMEAGKQLSATGQKTISVKTKTRRGAVIQTPIPSIRVGDAELHKVTGVFVSPDSPADMDATYAVLGMNFLRYFKTTISYARQKIVLIPATAQPAE